MERAPRYGREIVNGERSDAERDRLARLQALEQIFRPLAQELPPEAEPAVLFEADAESGE